MENINNVLDAYGIHPVSVHHITENLYYISDGHHKYALKKANLTRNNLTEWEMVFHHAFNKHLQSILPLYLTKQDRLYKEDNNSFYYLSPWTPSNTITQHNKIEQIYREIAIIHAKTKQTRSMDGKKFMQSFKKYQTNVGNMKMNLLQFVEKFEKNRFMSPFELLVCMQYRELEVVLSELFRRIDYLMEVLEKQTNWNCSMCHGQLAMDHVLFSHRTYFINWEKAHTNNAIIDLNLFFKNMVKDYDSPVDSLIDLFTYYEEENKLTPAESYLLSIYLLDPTDYIAAVENYSMNASSSSMIIQIKQLQHQYRKLLFGLKWMKQADAVLLSNDELES